MLALVRSLAEGSAQALKPRRISLLRRVVQIFSFAVILYGGFGLLALRGQPLPAPSTSVRPVFKRNAAVDVFIPPTACVFQKSGLCEGCGLYFLSDAITWQKSLDGLLPVLLPLLLFWALGARLWCGWICPLGLCTDALGHVRVRLGVAQVRLRRRTRQALVWTKYVLLALSLGIAAWAATPFAADARLSLVDPFCQVCPARIVEAFLTFDQVCWYNSHDGITIAFSVVGFVAFGLFFVGLTVRRFWCRLCPIGGLAALWNRTGLEMIVKDGRRCTHCGACARSCPLDVQRVFLSREGGDVTSPECHLCLRCVEACPEPGCLGFRWLGRKVVDS